MGDCGVAIAGSHLYWARRAVAIARASLDGTGVDLQFIRGLASKHGGAIAAAGGHIYWTNLPDAAAAIGRANLDGTGVNQRFIRTAGDPGGVAVYRGHIYWCQEKRGLAHPSTTIGRANLNGSAVNNRFITGIHHSCSGLAVG
jgi:hypothetical protein